MSIADDYESIARELKDLCSPAPGSPLYGIWFTPTGSTEPSHWVHMSDSLHFWEPSEGLPPTLFSSRVEAEAALNKVRGSGHHGSAKNFEVRLYHEA